MGTIAYVPDLGMDLIRQFHFDEETGVCTPCGEIKSGIKVGNRGLGPRYLSFATDTPTCYVTTSERSNLRRPRRRTLSLRLLRPRRLPAPAPGRASLPAPLFPRPSAGAPSDLSSA